MTSPRVLLTGAAVLLVLVAAAGAVAALRSRPATEPAAPASTSVTETVNPSPGDTGDYWTEERMRSAEPN